MPAAITRRAVARYAGCTMDRNGSGAVDEKVQFVFSDSQDLITG
jgi:hypothetical protein